MVKAESGNQIEIRGQAYAFEGQRRDETILLTIRQHTWFLSPIVFVWLILIIGLIVIFKYFGASRVSSIAILIVALSGGFFSFFRYFLWVNGVCIVTSQRVVKVHQLGLFNRLISEAELGRIQEISTQVRGPIRTMLNFGTVIIQTASSTGRMDLVNVPNPYSVQQAIVRIQRQNSAL